MQPQGGGGLPGFGPPPRAPGRNLPTAVKSNGTRSASICRGPSGRPRSAASHSTRSGCVTRATGRSWKRCASPRSRSSSTSPSQLETGVRRPQHDQPPLGCDRSLEGPRNARVRGLSPAGVPAVARGSRRSPSPCRGSTTGSISASSRSSNRSTSPFSSTISRRQGTAHEAGAGRRAQLSGRGLGEDTRPPTSRSTPTPANRSE